MDADRKNVTWDCLYRYIYPKEDWSFWGLFNFSDSKRGRVLLKKGIEQNELSHYYKTFIDAAQKVDFNISGDADWNTKKWTPKEHYIEKMHMFPNFSIMPCTGGMNNKKGHFGYRDKFNLFLYKLSGFYEIDKEDNYKRKEYVEKYLWHNSWKRKTTIEPLLEYLNLFDCIYDYCKKIYLLNDGDLVNRIIITGMKVDKNERCMEEEIKLAEEYWKERKTIMKSKLPECCHSLLDKDINTEDYE